MNGARRRRNDMYELHQAGERTYYINCPAKIGVFVAADGVYLIDSGSDKDAGRRVKKILDEKGWRLKAILNTHSHADHIGGNQYLQQQTGCAVCAPGIEADFVRHPVLEPSFLYGGCPPKELRHKFLMAQGSDVSDTALPPEIEVIPLPGHSFDMVGFRTPDDVVFLADCLSSAATLEKYGIPFLYDVGAALATLEAVDGMKARLFIPSHAEAMSDISALARFNREKLLAAADVISDICKEPTTFEEILKAAFDRYGLNMTFEQYVLVGSTVRSFLSWMKGEGRLSAAFSDNRMCWTTN
jgi:glyoxylase-like metal-dependent hydrolase (beta-lactamase superfamily II)